MVQEKIDVSHGSRDICEKQEICVKSNKFVYKVGYMCEKLEICVKSWKCVYK